MHCGRSLGEELDGLVHAKGPYEHLHLARHRQRLPAGGEDGEARAPTEERRAAHLGGCVRYVLAVVQDDDGRPRARTLDHPVDGRLALIRVAAGSVIAAPIVDTMASGTTMAAVTGASSTSLTFLARTELSDRFQHEPRLAYAARADQGHEPGPRPRCSMWASSAAGTPMNDVIGTGSGKSTFLHCVAGLDRPTSGSVQLAGTDLGGLSEVALTKLRRRQIGFIFQAFNLLPALTVEQNILLPARLAGHRLDKAWVREVIARTGLDERRRHRPGERLSGGQQQRVGYCPRPRHAPETSCSPTSPPARSTSRPVAEVLEPPLRQCVEDDGLTIVMVTHDPSAAAHADSVLFLADGQIVDTLDHPTSDAVADRMSRLDR